VTDLNQNTDYLRASLKEALLDMNVRQHSAHGSKSSLEVLRDSRIIETLQLVLDRLDKIERGLNGE
jgi:hypothetical protein